MRVVIAGGSGSLGRALLPSLLSEGHEVVVLTRSAGEADRRPQGPGAQVRHIHWDARSAGPWERELDGEDVALINLSGRLVDARPTPATIAELTRSRVDATRALVEASTRCERPIRHWVQASTTAIWSDAGEARLDETSPIPEGLPQMTGVAERWEQALAGHRSEHTHVLRTSIVLEAGTPALDRLLMLARRGLGGPVGGGRQWVSWIHVEDWVRIVLCTLGLADPTLPDGVIVASAPHPVRNAELMSTLRRSAGGAGRHLALPTPEPVLRLGALLLRTDPALGLTGRHATSRVLDDAGFAFRYPTLAEAVPALLGR